MMPYNHVSRNQVVTMRVSDEELADYILDAADNELIARVESIIQQDAEVRAKIEVLRDAFGISGLEEPTFVNVVHRILEQPSCTTAMQSDHRRHSVRPQSTSRPVAHGQTASQQRSVVPIVDFDERLVDSEDKGLCDKLPYKKPPVQPNSTEPILIDYDDRLLEAEATGVNS